MANKPLTAYHGIISSFFFNKTHIQRDRVQIAKSKKRKKFLLFIPILLFHNFIYVDRFFLLLLCLAGRHSHLVGGDCSLDTASYAIAAAAAAAESLLDMTNR